MFGDFLPISGFEIGGGWDFSISGRVLYSRGIWGQVYHGPAVTIINKSSILGE